MKKVLHIVAKHNKTTYPHSKDEIFKVTRKTNHIESGLPVKEYAVSASKFDKGWSKKGRERPFLTLKDDGNGFIVSKNMGPDSPNKDYRLEYCEAQELLMVLILDQIASGKYDFQEFKKGKNGRK